MREGAIPQIGVLISGRGSNLQALIDAVSRGDLQARLAVVISNQADAAGLAHAADAGIETVVIDHRAYPSRDGFDRALVEALHDRKVDLVCLAGFMRLLGAAFCGVFANRILNIHPSLLPSFPGVDAQGQAFRHGVTVTGATVHFVTAELDAGPIVQQACVAAKDDDTPASLAARILHVEHTLYPAAIQRILHGRWHVEGRRVVFAKAAAP